MSREIEVARVAEVPEDEAVGYKVGGIDIVLCSVDGEIYAFQGMCTHEDLPLDSGEVCDGLLTCEWHGAQFDARTGEVRGLPATRPLRAYDTVVREGKVYLVLDEDRT